MKRNHLIAALLSLAAIGSAQAVTTTSVTGTGSFTNSPNLLIDGDFGLGTWWTDPTNVFWQGQEGTGGAVFTLTFDQAYTLKDVSVGLDNNDFYAVQVSNDAVTWNTLFVSLPTNIDPNYLYSGASMIKKTSVAGDPGYSPLIDFAPVQAKYARVYAITGDSSYAVSEVQFSGVAVVPEPAAAALMLAGLGALALAARRRR